MQLGFGFASADVARWHTRLAPLRQGVALLPRRTPVAQLVKSIISGRTRDAVSQAAFDRLTRAFGTPSRLAGADPVAVERMIWDVTFADAKARHLVDAMRRLVAGPIGFRLEALGDRPVAAGLALLEALPGVARKVSAATLNASTLAMPVMIVDTHVLRVLTRLRLVPGNADYRAASEAVTAAMPGWDGEDFLAFHIALKRLGQLVCRPEMPLCGDCLLAADCPTRR